MTLGGFIAGIGGSIYAHTTTHVEHLIFGVVLATFAIAYPILGGLSHVLGTLLAVIFVQVFLIEDAAFHGRLAQHAVRRLIVLVMNLRPHGLLGEQPAKMFDFLKPRQREGHARS
jgi:branched-chain amino acid transport system permease protein